MDELLKQYIIKNSLKEELYTFKASNQVPIHFNGFKIFQQKKYAFKATDHTIKKSRQVIFNNLKETIDCRKDLKDLGIFDDECNLSNITTIEYTVYCTSDFLKKHSRSSMILTKRESGDHDETFSKYKVINSFIGPLEAYGLERDYEPVYMNFLSDFAEKLGDPLLFSKNLNAKPSPF